MPNTIEVQAPDGLNCQVAHSVRGFSPIGWNPRVDGSIYIPREPSGGLKAHLFATSHAAMMAAHRERLQQEQAIEYLALEAHKAAHQNTVSLRFPRENVFFLTRSLEVARFRSVGLFQAGSGRSLTRVMRRSPSRVPSRPRGRGSERPSR
jgi:hypothetical protein